MIIMLVLQFLLYHHLKLPISIAELSIKGIHVMQMLFYNAWRSFQFCGPPMIELNRRLISDLVGEVDENAYHAKSAQLHLQGYWTKWCDFVKNGLSWKTLLAMPSSLISFCLGATFDTLPSPSNLKCWRVVTESSCFLCGKSICTSAHILGACKIALYQGRFSFRKSFMNL